MRGLVEHMLRQSATNNVFVCVHVRVFKCMLYLCLSVLNGVCVCVCVCVCVNICIYVYVIHIHIHIHTHV